MPPHWRLRGISRLYVVSGFSRTSRSWRFEAGETYLLAVRHVRAVRRVEIRQRTARRRRTVGLRYALVHEECFEHPRRKRLDAGLAAAVVVVQVREYKVALQFFDRSHVPLVVD